MLEITNLSVDYFLPDGSAVPVLKDFNLDVDAGEIVVLLGASGSGKSTLLRAIAGLEPLADGRIVFAGQDLAGIPTHKRNIGMVFQSGELFPNRNVYKNISYGLEIQRKSRAEQDARVRELLDLVGLSGYENREITTLSGGQAQRVALARSLAPQPAMLLLDEPLSALDRELRERLAIDIHRILKASDTAAIYVTHDHEEAETVADRIIQLTPLS
ncbi:MAG: ABC transporter ATP-binding protein [Actinomycetaceae bacterium]|nr:ABC transporter ATP-binding protein [Actinomycetaceae bacterium]